MCHPLSWFTFFEYCHTLLVCIEIIRSCLNLNKFSSIIFSDNLKFKWYKSLYSKEIEKPKQASPLKSVNTFLWFYILANPNVHIQPFSSISLYKPSSLSEKVSQSSKPWHRLIVLLTSSNS